MKQLTIEVPTAKLAVGEKTRWNADELAVKCCENPPIPVHSTATSADATTPNFLSGRFRSRLSTRVQPPRFFRSPRLLR
ncbi:hypothetical protein J1N35_030119 [Gossypium stocksii]|uniref:Uncharacterized protein n=1 Tax=Gossypium stocksii TaxID=47602 RepID=A0A9D3UZ20_9ROSI|nr:hypothetical protein J1N35_030119 [Gossypium stocksii]